MSLTQQGFLVQQAGVHTLIQDAGRFGKHSLGLTNGGPLDRLTFDWANRLCQNKANLSALEVTVGGLVLISKVDTQIAVTGPNIEYKINDRVKELWCSHQVNSGDVIKFGFLSQGMRVYLAVAGGFQIPLSFGSSATVCRENIGGIRGEALLKGDFLAVKSMQNRVVNNYILVEKYRPKYENRVVLRTILSYQQQHFSTVAKRLFFSSEYTVSDRYDRMGYRLTGEKINANIEGILSEGICHGAIQIPADGQPIVLLNDRQTIGGYPKIGAVISLDTAKIAQLGQGAKVRFEQITMEDAHNINHLACALFENISLKKC